MEGEGGWGREEMIEGKEAGGREGGRDGGREGEEWREGGVEGGREGGREGGHDGGEGVWMEGGKEEKEEALMEIEGGEVREETPL